MTNYKHQPQTPTVLKIEAPVGNPISGFIKDPTKVLVLPKECIMTDEEGPAGKMKRWSGPSKDEIVRFAHKLLTDEMTNMGIPWIAGYANEEAVAKAYDKFFLV